MIKIKNIYPYKELKRNDGKVRTYETEGGKKLASVTSIISETQTEEKKQGYESDITYGTNNEFGFDYLRDNMAFRLEQKCRGI